MQEIIQRYFNISNDASASLIVTLITFTLGYLITAIVYMLSQYSKRRITRRIIWNLFESIEASLQKKEKALLDTISSIDIANNSNWQYNRVNFASIEAFKELGYKEAFSSLFLGLENTFSIHSTKNKRQVSFNRVWAILNQVQYINEKSLEYYHSTLTSYNQLNDNRNLSLTNCRKKWESLFADSAGNVDLIPGYDTYLSELSLIIKKYRGIPTSVRVNPFTTQRKLVLPIRILNKQNFGLPEVKELNDYCLEASSRYQNMENETRFLKLQLKEFYYSIREDRRKIKVIKEILL